MLNSDLIKYIESTPDTMITLSSGEKLLVQETIDGVIAKTMDFRKRLVQEPPMSSAGKGGATQSGER